MSLQFWKKQEVTARMFFGAEHEWGMTRGEESVRHLDLFSGIGGFALAASQVFENYETVAFCEIDPFCQAILNKNFPGVPIHDDIRTLTNTANPRPEGMQGWEDGVFLVTGGFPCQPFSQAGQRKGTADDRHLWPEMFRVITEFKPTWILAENVSGLLTWGEGMVFEQVCADLESQGYEVQAFVIPACGVNAPHQRYRVWIAAHHANTTGKRLEGRNRPRLSRRSQVDWTRDWREVAAATCHDGVDDGLPRRMGGSTISRARWRREALKAYGNAIVPQVAIEIMKAIKESHVSE